MRIRHIVLTVLPMLLFLFQACAPIYVASSHQTPLLDKKGELNGKVQAGTHGIDVQGAYAFSDHLGMTAAGSFAELEAVQGGTVNENYHKHSYGEAALTYFRPIGGIGRFEIMSGLGLGESSAVETLTFSGAEERTTGKYNKLFVQSNIGLETNFIEAGLALRLAQVTFTEFATETLIYEETEGGTFFEPAAFVRLGWKNIKLESQVGVNALLQEDAYFPYQMMHFSMGINVNLNTR